MKLYGFWRSLATYRVNVALALKGMKVDEEVSIDLLKGQQLNSDYRAVNPQAVVPSLVLDDGGPPLFQSLAILEYLEETKPQPPLLPKDPRGRARVRGLALISAADGHPLVAGTIVGSGTIANEDTSKGASCFAEQRVVETLRDGKPSTPFMSFGDVVRIEMLDAAGNSIFGAIEQRIEQAARP